MSSHTSLTGWCSKYTKGRMPFILAAVGSIGQPTQSHLDRSACLLGLMINYQYPYPCPKGQLGTWFGSHWPQSTVSGCRASSACAGATAALRPSNWPSTAGNREAISGALLHGKNTRHSPTGAVCANSWTKWENCGLLYPISSGRLTCNGEFIGRSQPMGEGGTEDVQIRPHVFSYRVKHGRGFLGHSAVAL